MNSIWFVIVNPNAGNGKGRKDWTRIAGIFEREKIAIVPAFTEKRGHASDLAKNAVAAGYRNVVCVGGDGTLNEVVNGIFSQKICPASEVSLALIPVGTGNDWGRMFGIPLVYEGAIKAIKDNKRILHDIGIIKYHQGEKQLQRHFINIAGIGFEAMVVMRTNKQKERGRSNTAIYFYNLLSSLISYRKTNAEIVIDGIPLKARIFSLNVGNGRYCGGGMRQTPDALPNDGLLDVTLIREIGRIEIIRSLKILYDGTILSHPKVDGYRAKNISVTSKELLLAEADGESLGHTPVEFSIIPSAINIVYGYLLIQ
jgi:YegS/Rv2252/BmrU family lipid kinase